MKPTFSKPYWRLARRNLTDYTHNSSIHGVRYIGQKKRAFGERLLWSVMLLVLLVTCATLIFDVFLKWQHNPVIVSFANSPTPIWHIPFPAVTICSETKAQGAKLNITKMYHRFAGRKDLLYHLKGKKKSKMTAIAQVCDPSVFGQIDPKNISDCSKCVDTLRSIAIPKEDTIALIYFGKKRFHRDELFEETVTEEGICYTFNGIQIQRHPEDQKPVNWSLEKGYMTPLMDTYPRRAIGVGTDYTLHLYLGLCDFDFDFICRKSGQGFKLLLHMPNEVPQISRHFQRIPFKQDVRVMIKPQKISTSNSLKSYSPITRQCYFEGERYLQYFKEYTKRNCELECFTNYTQLECGCTLFNMPRPNNQTKSCGAGKIVCINDARKKIPNINCGCLPSCSMITYDAEISQAESNILQFFGASNSKRLKPKDYYVLEHCPLTQVTVYFKEEQFISLVRSEFYDTTAFVSNCGGLLGLFLGISLMSLIEIVYFCSIRLACSFQLHHRRMKHKLSKIVWVKPVSQEFKRE